MKHSIKCSVIGLILDIQVKGSMKAFNDIRIEGGKTHLVDVSF